MTAKKTVPAFQLGDRVTVEYFPHWRGRIVELRGPLGPGGVQVYRVRIRQKPKPFYVELCEDQLIRILIEDEPSRRVMPSAELNVPREASAVVTAAERGPTTAAKTSAPAFKLGDRVTVRHYPHWRGRIVELRGPLAPGGVQVYRIRLPGKPKSTYVELSEDLLILIPAEE